MLEKSAVAINGSRGPDVAIQGTGTQIVEPCWEQLPKFKEELLQRLTMDLKPLASRS